MPVPEYKEYYTVIVNHLCAVLPKTRGCHLYTKVTAKSIVWLYMNGISILRYACDVKAAYAMR